MTEGDTAYLAGLIDGEGSIQYKQYMRKRAHNKKAYPTWSIRLEIAMTDKDTIKWCHETFKVGHWGERKVKPGKKRQWRWRVSHRDCLKICINIWPYAKTKLHKVEQIIDHYETYDGLPKNVVDLEEYRLTRKFNWNLHGS
jgi:hypothetical protein